MDEGESKSEPRKRKSLAYLPFGLLLLVACYSTYRLGHSFEAYQFQAQDYAQREQAKATPRIIRECLGLEPRPFAKCFDETVEAGAERQREAYDLVAQQKVAEGSLLLIGLGIFELALTLWGILVLRDQLIANQTATEAMIEANRITEEAAERTLNETRRIGEAQVRCYLTGVSAKFGFTTGGEGVICFRVKNTGQSPARGVHCSGQICLSSGEGEYEFFDGEDGEDKSRVDIASGVEEEIVIVVKDTTMDRWEPTMGSLFVSIKIKIMATDVFDRPAPESERFTASLEAKPEMNGWVELKRAAQLT